MSLIKLTNLFPIEVDEETEGNSETETIKSNTKEMKNKTKQTKVVY